LSVGIIDAAAGARPQRTTLINSLDVNYPETITCRN
jgi:hypothetical protein